MTRWLIVLAIVVLPATARAQGDVITLARTAAGEGRRVEALTMLEQHLAQSPGDVDARLVYGLVLSWEGRYDDARRELRRVLAEAPDYADARNVLTNVDRWSRRRGAPGRGWTANVSYSHDRFSDDRGSWHEEAISLSRSTPIGSVVVRGTRASRFSLTDEQVDVELYPAFRPGTYAYVGLGVAPGAALYPRRRGALDLYQSLGGGFEVSAGYRGLQFDEVTNIYVLTLTKYLGSWMASGKAYHVPGRGAPDSTSYHGVLRRYFGADGTSFAGFGYGHGLSREEVRSLGDVATIAGDTVRGQIDVAVTEWWRLQLEASTSRQEQSWGTVWQTTLGTGLSRRF